MGLLGKRVKVVKGVDKGHEATVAKKNKNPLSPNEEPRYILKDDDGTIRASYRRDELKEIKK